MAALPTPAPADAPGAGAADDLETLRRQFDQARATLLAHDQLIRSLLTHLALTDPEAIGGMIAGFARSRAYDQTGEAGDVTRQVAEQLTELLESVAAGLNRR